MTVKSQAAQGNSIDIQEFIRNYELSAKIMGDPVEMQRKINNGTKPYILGRHREPQQYC